MATSALEQSRKELAGEYERVQKKAFTNWVNSHLIKAGQQISDLYEDFKDGSKLCLLLELLTGEKVGREKGKMRVHKLQNVQNALDLLQRKKIKLVNIRNDEIVDGNPKLILGLVWTLILHFQISSYLAEESPSTPTHQVSAKELKQQLLDWAKKATEGYEEVEVKNLHTSWRDGLAFCAILDRHRPDIISYDDCNPDTPMENLEKAFKTAETELGIVRIVDPEDICVEKPDEKAVMTYVSFLYHAFPDMPPPHHKKAPVVSLDDYRELYEATKEWIDSKTAEVKSRTFPNNIKDMEARIATFKKYKSGELPIKQREMAILEDLYGKLEAQKKRKKSNASPRSPTVPIQLAFPALQMDWMCLQKETEYCEGAMQEELQRLKDLQALAEKLLGECDECSVSLDQLEARVEQFEVTCTTMSPEEAQTMADELSRDIKALEQPVESLAPSLQELRTGNYHDIDTVQQRVDSVRSRLSSLSPRLEGAWSAAGEAQAVVAMETNISELEVWLVSCGKFADNQQILVQIEEHKAFQLEQISASEERIARINRSPPPPGLEEKVSEMNGRWERVVRQTKDRVSGLEPIVDTVREFDALKIPLEEWCTRQREFFDNLPPLEPMEEELRSHQAEMKEVHDDILAHKSSIEKLEVLAQNFLRDTEPVQSLADRYARKLKSQAVSAEVRGRRDSEVPEASVGEQAAVLQGQWEWLLSQAEGRSSTTESLLDRLGQFNQQYDALRAFLAEGERQLEEEKPVGSTAARIQEQMETCQSFRSQLTNKQPEIDAMLALGRAIIAEPTTNPQNESFPKKLTSFIEDLADLQLAYQNWYDELHGGLQQSKNLSDQLGKFASGVNALEPACNNILPATITMDNLESELKALQERFTTEVLQPYEEQKAVFTSLKSSAALLPDQQSSEEVFGKFESVSATIESLNQELSGVVLDVGEWWGECDGVREWVGAAEGRLVDVRPLAGSVDIVEEQRNSVQTLSEEVESRRPAVERVLQSLTSLATHQAILNPDPISTFTEDLRTRWKSVQSEVEGRQELVTRGKDQLSSYAGQAVPFTVWLTEAEGKLEEGGGVPRNRERLFSKIEELDVFMNDVISHGEELDGVEKVGSQFLSSAKAYQSRLLDFRQQSLPEEGGKLPQFFVDLESHDLGTPSDVAPQFEGDVYENGIKVVSGNSTTLRRRYDALQAGLRAQKERMDEAKLRRQEFDNVLGAFIPDLDALEERCRGVSGEGDSVPERIQERVEAVQSLEVDCLAMEPKLQALNSAYGMWAEAGEGGTEGEEDDALGAKEGAEGRYHALLDRTARLKEALLTELTDAQAFQDAFGDFIVWLRETERKIQRDDPLKLEVGELKTGLAHLQTVAGDIQAHEKVFEAVCSKCQELMGRGVQDVEELQRKLENLQQRWAGLQIVTDDIEVIEETIPKLEAFYSSYSGISDHCDSLLEKLQDFSPSATSTEGLEEKNQNLQELSDGVEQKRAEFDVVVSSCDLLETPFDQSHFESDVSGLQEKMAECDKVASDKRQRLKSLERKIRPMEDLFGEFQVWLQATGDSLEALRPFSVETEQRGKQLEQAMAIIEEVKDHRDNLEHLKVVVEEVLPFLEEDHQVELNSKLQTVSFQYHHLLFQASCYPVDMWLEDRSLQLAGMAPSGVLVVPLQEQISKAQEFQRSVEGYRETINSLATLVITDQSAAGTGEADQSSSGKSETESETEISVLRSRYDSLEALVGSRLSVCTGFLPTVQQYESSQDAWANLLREWEERTAILPPPGGRPETVLEQAEEIKALQQAVQDHEPELSSLKKESQILCRGPPSEADYVSQLADAGTPPSGDGTAPSPGQIKMEETLDDFYQRLEALKRLLADSAEGLSSQLERAQEFQDVLGRLLAWVGETEDQLNELRVMDVSSAAVESQLEKCQGLLTDLTDKTAEKNKLAPLFDALTSALPDENEDREHMKNQLDQLDSAWSSLSDRLDQNHSNLDRALNLARSYEGSSQKLLPWVPNTLSHLENLGPPPSEPEAVEKLKSDIESLKSEYNSLAPSFATCTEDGASLANCCQSPEAKAALEEGVGLLQTQWEGLGKLFGDVLQKLTDALVQTQEFQAIANGLGRWMDSMKDVLEQQDTIAARVKLIESQIEGFKPIMNDIEAYGSTVEQARTIGGALIEESDPEEKQKIQTRLEALVQHFSQLKSTTQTRMADLEDALQKATAYENQSNEFDKWLKSVEGKLSSWEPFSIASQPLKTQLEAIEELSQEVESQRPALGGVNTAEERLFDDSLSAIQGCEEHVLQQARATGTSPESSVDKPVLPGWLSRGGASEAVEVGANLRDRYDKLKVSAGGKCDEASQLLQRVLAYESSYDDLQGWLRGEKARAASFSPPAITVEELKAQLQEVEAMQSDFQNRAESLEAINSAGTELVDSCKDELSRDSGRIKLSDLNESWGNTLAELGAREDHLKEGLVLAEKYQALHDAFDSWLCDCEAKAALPLQTEGDPLEIRRQLEELKALLSEVEAHSPQLDEAVMAGRELESYTDAERSALPDIGYTSLQERYETLKSNLSGHLSLLEGALGHVSGLKDRLMELLLQLEDWRSKLKGHEPPHVLPVDVEKQLQQLASLKQAVDELRPTVTQAEEEGRAYTTEEEASSTLGDDVPSGAEFQSLLSALTQTSGEVDNQLSYWEDLLQAGLKTAQKFEGDHSALLSWVKSKEEQLASAETVRGDPEGVREQLRELQELQDELLQHQPALDSLSTLGHSMMDDASPEDSVIISDQLSHIQAAVEALQRNANARRRALEEGLAQATEFAAGWGVVMELIDSKHEELQQLAPVGADIDAVKIQLEEYKELEASLSELKPKVTTTLAQGKQLKDNCSARDGAMVNEKLDKLNTAWSQLYSDGLSRKHQLEDALLQLGQFHDALAELLTWIATTTAKLLGAEPPGARPETVEAHLLEIESLESDIASHQPSVSSLHEAGERLITSSSAENTAEIQQDLSDLTNKWERLSTLTAERRALLEAALEKARHFNDSWRKEVHWLSEAEKNAYADWKPCGLPETCEADITKHEVFASEVREHGDAVEALRKEGEGVKEQGGVEEARMVDRWVMDVASRWEDLGAAVEEREAQLQQAKSRALELDESYLSTLEKVLGCEQAQQAWEPIHSEAQVVKQQLETHKEYLKQLTELESQLDELDGLGQLLSKGCIKEDGEIIQQRIADLRSRWDALHSAAMERQSSLEESLLSLGEFEEAYEELWAWLNDALRQLEEAEPITGDPDVVGTQLAKHKALQKQLGARLSSRNAVTKAGKLLMKHKTGEDKVVLKKKMQDLEREWEKVCQLSVERQDKLEEAYRIIGQFRSNLGPLRSWMAKVMPSLDEAEPVHGDVHTVDFLMATHSSFQKELGSHQKGVDAANATGKHLVEEILDDPAITRQDLQELNETWEGICQSSIKKQERLDEASQAAKEFEGQYNELLLWMEAQSEELLSMPPPDEDTAMLQLQLDDHKAFSQEIAGRQPEFDKILATGHNLLQLAHPRAVPVLQSKLQQLERNWVDLRGRVGVRSEALASALLELHGLQDMLENLWQWVGEAEGTMADTEAQPIGDNLETVEQQLAEHEAFQEEMATQQPNMDALNKAAKKRKATHPHANPEMSKRITSLYKKWQKLWLRSSDRHRHLLEARTRLKDIALARSFDFDVWRKRFNVWADQQKLRVRDLFRRFDSNHDGMLTREEFMKGLKASGLAMNQIEMEKIADALDPNHTNVIDLNEIVSVLKGFKRSRTLSKERMSDTEKIDHEIEHQVSQCTCAKKFKVTRVAEGQYRFGDSQKLRLVRILRSTVMVRVGGGWEPLEEFLLKHDPCRASGRTNADLRSLLSVDRTPGLATAGFTSKRQTSTAAKNAAMRKAAAEDPHSKVVTRTLPSGRKETVVTTKKPVAATPTARAKNGTPPRGEPIRHTLLRQTTPTGASNSSPRVQKSSTPPRAHKSSTPPRVQKSSTPPRSPAGRLAGSGTGAKASRIPTPKKTPKP